MRMPILLLLFFFYVPSLATSVKIDYLTSAMVRTDPIVSPGTLSGHLHTFFGAAIADPSTTYDDLRASSTKNSGNVVENKSLYWYPTIYRLDDTTGLYHVSEIYHHSSYYIWHPETTTAFPNGFKMVIYGSSECFTETTESGGTVHVCGRARAECVNPGGCPGGDCTTLNGFFPATTCVELEMSIELPDCWDGVNLDSSDHSSHVSYEDPITEECPSTHSTRIPKVFVFTRIIDYPGGKHLFSDGSGTFHTDYFSGWDQNELQYVLDNCFTDSYAPMPDSFCDNGPKGKQNGWVQDPKFLTFLDGPKKNTDPGRSIPDDLNALIASGQLSPQIDTSYITTEAITGIPYLPGSTNPGSTGSSSTTLNPETSIVPNTDPPEDDNTADSTDQPEDNNNNTDPPEDDNTTDSTEQPENNDDDEHDDGSADDDNDENIMLDDNDDDDDYDSVGSISVMYVFLVTFLVMIH